jgi:phospho-N-acetylmuramoyl-pentapeptide-transferase
VIGVIFVAEALSDVIQIGSYRLRGGKRVFRMAPLHHHFEKLGWAETTVVTRFYILGLLCALVALSTLKVR